MNALSIGSGTRVATLQLGVIQRLTEYLSFDGAIDVSLTADHTERGDLHSQHAQVEVQGYLRYALSSRTNVSFGYAGFFGGKRYVDDVYQGINLRLTRCAGSSIPF